MVAMVTTHCNAASVDSSAVLRRMHSSISKSEYCVSVGSAVLGLKCASRIAVGM